MNSSDRRVISTDQAPAAIGAYSQAVQVGNTVYISGQIPLLADTMEVVEGGFDAQARQVIVNLQAIAQAAGGSLSDAVKLNVFLTDLGNFAALNVVFSDMLSEPFPARAAVEVSALPRDVMLEIDAVLCVT